VEIEFEGRRSPVGAAAGDQPRFSPLLLAEEVSPLLGLVELIKRISFLERAHRREGSSGRDSPYFRAAKLYVAGVPTT
jgi:hypothetical protein